MRAFDDDLPAARGRHRLAPPRGHQAGGEVREGREDEEAVTHRWMRDIEEARGGTGVDRRGQGHALGRPFDGQPMATEDQQVEVELARAPPPSSTAAERALEVLEGDEQGVAPVAGSGPAGTSSATTAFKKSGWSVTPTGLVR